jgi:hypothetical protein
LDDDDDDVEDSNEVQKTSSQMKDLERGRQDTNSLHQSNKHPKGSVINTRTQ